MEAKKALDKAGPFGALIAASSLIAALLYVSGFSYRWAYYYNFGIQHIVFDLTFQSFLITAIELIRMPKNLFLSFLLIICPLIVLNGIIQFIRRAAASEWNPWVKKPAVVLTTVFGLESPLIVESLRAVLIVYTVYMLSSHVGYVRFREHIIDSPDNPLPKVAVVIGKGEDANKLALSCGANTVPSVQVIGDAKRIRLIQEAFRTCNTRGTTWRLLYRDKGSIVVFASKTRPAGRPLTLVLPNNENTYVVME